MTGAQPGVCSKKQLRVLLLPPGWDASPSQGYSTMAGKQHDSSLKPLTFRSEVHYANHYTTVPPQRINPVYNVII